MSWIRIKMVINLKSAFSAICVIFFSMASSHFFFFLLSFFTNVIKIWSDFWKHDRQLKRELVRPHSKWRFDSTHANRNEEEMIKD